MKIGYKRLLIFMIILMAILFYDILVQNFLFDYRMIGLLIALLIFFHSYFILEKDRHRYLKDILFEVSLFVLTYFILYYLLGLIVGLAKTQNYLTAYGLKTFIIPSIFYCILREVFRYNMLCKSEGSKLCTITTIGLFILLDISNSFYHASFHSQYEIFRVFALTLLPTISKNISYSYVSRKMGYKPVIFFDLIWILFPYLIPLIPNPNEYMVSIIYLLVPIFYAYRISRFFEWKKDDMVPRDYRKKKIKGILLPTILVMGMVYLYSGYFKFYAIAIASGSMYPNIKKGDIVIVDQKYKNYDSDDVIAFRHNNNIIVHRIIKKVEWQDSYIYYTKGDANSKIDDVLVKKEMIVGKVKGKIPYI